MGNSNMSSFSYLALFTSESFCHNDIGCTLTHDVTAHHVTHTFNSFHLPVPVPVLVLLVVGSLQLHPLIALRVVNTIR
jgi:hypothetical protein